MVQVFGAGAADKRVADGVVELFNDPPAAVAALSSPAAAEAFVDRLVKGRGNGVTAGRQSVQRPLKKPTS